MQLEADAKRDAAKPRRRRDDPEHQLQCLAIQWVALRTGRYPELELLHAIPNAARRTKRERGRLLAEGLKAGVWDLFLPVPRCGFAGLYLETKIHERRPVGGKVRMVKTSLTPAQRDWQQRVREQGYCCRVYHNLEELEAILIDYLEGRLPRTAEEPGLR